MLNNLLKKIKSANKVTLGLIAVVILVLIGGIFAVKQFTAQKVANVPLQEVDMPFDPEGPYALLVPRRDGHALILNITRVSSYDSISYELTYQSKPTGVKNLNAPTSGEDGAPVSQGIDRGVQGTIDTKGKKNEYSQEILFGTCSKGNTSDPLHCVFDQGVENGTLLLKIQKGSVVYKSLITWHLQQPDVALGVITSGDGHFTYKTQASKDQLANIGWTIVNDLSGAPKLPSGKDVLGKVYSFNVPPAKNFPNGVVTIELGENPSQDAQIARYNDSKNSWEMLDTKINGSTLTANSETNGIFAVLINKAN
jgi:hypothetical protein